MAGADEVELALALTGATSVLDELAGALYAGGAGAELVLIGATGELDGAVYAGGVGADELLSLTGATGELDGAV
jgi:hypothetical protein